MAQKDKPQKETGLNRRELLNAMEAVKHPKVDTRDIQAIEQRINEYLHFCLEKDISPSIPGCANWLGINIRTLDGWYTGYRGSPEHQETAARFYGIIQDVWSQKMEDGRINPVSGIYTSKVFFGFREQQEIVIQDGRSQGQLSVADLIAESKRLPGAENLSLTDNAQTIDAEYKVIEKPIEDDEYHQKAVDRKKRADERKAAVEAYAPIKKAKRKAYLKEYYQEKPEKFTSHSYRNTPEGREQYNAYMREYQRRKRAEKNTRSSDEQANNSPI